MQLTEITDDLDPGIADVVNLLRSHGIDTFSSCEGGEGHDFVRPTVRVNLESESGGIEEYQIAQVLSEAGYGGYYIKQVRAYQNDPRPWQQPGQHFIEIEFWDSLVKAEE